MIKSKAMKCKKLKPTNHLLTSLHDAFKIQFVDIVPVFLELNAEILLVDSPAAIGYMKVKIMTLLIHGLHKVSCCPRP